MTRAYLLVNAVLYVLFAVWCTAAPEKTSEALGLKMTGGSGKSEYLTVYGGMEMGIAAFFAACALRAEWREAGLLFGVCFYAGLVLWRVPTLLLVPGISGLTYATAALEALLAAAGLVLWWTGQRG